MSLEKVIKKYKQARNITDEYNLDEDEMYFVNEILELEKQLNLLTIPVVVKSLPNDEEVKAHIDTLPYYGTCTTEYNEGFEDGVKWLKDQLAK